MTQDRAGNAGPTAPPADLPADIWAAVERAAVGEDDPHAVGAALVAWADGRGLDSLIELLE